MTPKTLLLAALIAGPLFTAPAFAQPAPPAPPAAQHAGPHHGAGPKMGQMGARMFPSMSEAGRKMKLTDDEVALISQRDPALPRPVSFE